MNTKVIDPNKKVAARIKAIREYFDETQQVFSDKIGIERAYLASLETGKQFPSSNVLLKLKTTINANTDWLLIGEGEMFSNRRTVQEGEHIRRNAEDMPRLPCGLYGKGELVYVPLSSITACCGSGSPVFEDYDIGESVTARRSVLGTLDASAPPFAVETHGRSMEGYGIREGSTVIVNPLEKPTSGNIVLAVIDEKASIKKYYVRSDCVELVSSTTTPLRYSFEEVQEGWGIRICGRVMLVIAQPEDGV